jgi:hypothetical protein
LNRRREKNPREETPEEEEKVVRDFNFKEFLEDKALDSEHKDRV